MRRTYLLLFASLFSGLAFGQQTPPAPPARQESVVSPEIKENGHVLFRIKAPKAHEVSVRGQWSKEPVVLTAGANGIWSGEAESVPAGIWEYSMVVDGLSMIDPGNPALKPMREPRSSILHVPGTPPLPWDFQDVPHGAVHQHSYLSKVLNRPRELVVYTPPGYETQAAASFPLLILQHGSGDDEKTWVAHGKAHWILDNLIAAGKARPMVVLMLNGHPLGRFAPGETAKRTEALEAFRRELLEDAMPLVESRYRVQKEPAARGIVGLSMGGMQSLGVGLGNLGRFAWVGSFSGAVGDEATLQAVLANPADTNAKLRLLWIGVGQDDFLRVRNEELIAKLKAAGVKYEWRLSEGGHAWPVWRNYLVEFLPLLFQP